jgi:hypothetical protein
MFPAVSVILVMLLAVVFQRTPTTTRLPAVRLKAGSVVLSEATPLTKATAI